MKIGIDISQTAYAGTGVARYTTALVKSLLNAKSTHEFVFFFSSLRRKPPKELTDLIKEPHILKHFYFPPTLLSQMWNELHMVPIENFIGDVDVFISSDWVQPPVKKAKTISIVHDMVIYVHPETSTQRTTFNLKRVQIRPNIVDTQKRRLHWVAKDVDCIIADSESTKQDLETILKLKKKNVRVVYPSVYVEPTLLSKKHLKEKYALKKPYLLTVGKLEPRKNIPMLIKSFISSGLSEKNDLVIVGAQGWGDFKLDIPHDMKDAIKFLGYVPDDDLSSLYTFAELFVYPSVYEGFGYPVLEAMQCGTPVATSHTSSTGELADAYAHIFDPHDMQSISQVLVSVMKDEKLRLRYVDKAKKYALSFTQEKFGKEILEAIDSLA